MKFPISKYSISKQRFNFQTGLISKCLKFKNLKLGNYLEIVSFGNWKLRKLFGNYTVWSLEIAFFALILFLLAAKNVDAATINRPPLYLSSNNGLVGYWTMDGSKVNWATGAVTDSSGRGNTGTIKNMATSTATAAGKIGQALNFDGSNDYVSCPADGTNVLGKSISSFTVGTISAWFYSKTTTTGDIFTVSAGSAAFTMLEVRYSPNTDKKISFAVYSTVGPQLNRLTNNIFEPNRWHHVLVAQDGVQEKIYVNGILEPTSLGGEVGDNNRNRFISAVTSADTCRVGNRRTASADGVQFNGLIDDVRVYNRALSANEIKTLYNSGAAKFNVSPTKYLTDGLVGYWTMDGSKVNWKTGAVTDSSGRGNTGTIKNMATSTGVAAGRIGQALDFDGGDDYVNMGNVLDIGTGPITMSCWIKTTNGGNKQCVTKALFATPYTGYWLGVNAGVATGIASTGFWPQSGIGDRANSVTRVDDGKWHFIVGGRDGTNTFIYVDGKLENTQTDNLQNTTNTVSLEIGALQENLIFNGLIDDVRIYNRALSANEIKTLYNSGAAKFNVSPTKYLTDGLVGYWTMDGSKVNWATGAVTDSSGRGNTGTITNMATSTGVGAGKIGQALNFDGSNDYVEIADATSLKPTNVTVMAWFNAKAAGNDSTLEIVHKRQPSPTFVSYGLSWRRVTGESFDRVFARLGFISNGMSDLQSGSVTQNEWHHAVQTYDSTTHRLFIDGVQVASGVVSDTISYSTDSVTIASYNTSSEFFPGSIDDVRIYNRALSAGEIQQLYNAGR